jgi:hypothetical protein
MPSALRVRDMLQALDARSFPTITLWNRLEGRPRTQDFDRALRAEVRDALWMLTKQWQMGEFRGSDAGSPVSAKVAIDTTRLTKYRPGDGATEPFEYAMPLEAKVERRPLALRMGGRPMGLALRLAMGRRWLALVAPIGDYRQAYVDAYEIVAPDPTGTADADRCAHPEVWELFEAVAGRAMDGGAFYEHLTSDPSHHAYDSVAGISAADHADLDAAAARFLAWFGRLILRPPDGDDAWSPPRLDYRFAASAPEPGGAEKVYFAEDHSHGRLDWYSLDIDRTGQLDVVPGSDQTGLSPDRARTTIPVPVSFAGMPNTRWWAFEDRRTNYGDIDASTTDLAKLMFLEFAVVYSNDWFVIPCTLSAGTVATVRGLAVTNVFGERFWIESANAGAEADWQRWSMFTIDVHGEANAQADTSLLLLPTVPKVDESPPAEEVMLIRDEMANMVWGVETVVPLASGAAARGAEAARQLHAFLQDRVSGGPVPALPEPAAAVRYELMTSVPENWIPFQPVHVDAGNREVQLQRASLPRILDGEPGSAAKVKPRTALLREGLDRSPPEQYFVHEEEVPRAGTRVAQVYKRTRWIDGTVYVWRSVRRETGRGEGSSGLSFDELVDAPQDAS